MKMIQMEAQLFRWKKVTHNHDQAIMTLMCHYVVVVVKVGFFCFVFVFLNGLYGVPLGMIVVCINPLKNKTLTYMIIMITV